MTLHTENGKTQLVISAGWCSSRAKAETTRCRLCCASRPLGRWSSIHIDTHTGCVFKAVWSGLSLGSRSVTRITRLLSAWLCLHSWIWCCQYTAVDTNTTQLPRTSAVWSNTPMSNEAALCNMPGFQLCLHQPDVWNPTELILIQNLLYWHVCFLLQSG